VIQGFAFVPKPIVYIYKISLSRITNQIGINLIQIQQSNTSHLPAPAAIRHDLRYYFLGQAVGFFGPASS
jgi:hypothetical protein